MTVGRSNASLPLKAEKAERDRRRNYLGKVTRLSFVRWDLSSINKVGLFSRGLVKCHIQLADR